MATTEGPHPLLDETDRWRSQLREQGYAVVPGVLSASAVASAMAEMWSLMEALGTVRQRDASTWTRSDRWPPMLHGGMIQYLGHTPLQWSMREACAPVFARYYGCAPADLATSFDGLCMMHSARAYRSAGDLVSFLHTDQSPLRKGETWVQGLINLADGGPDDGGLVVIPGTHLEHEAFFAGHPSSTQKDDWYQLTAHERDAYRPRAVKVLAEPGDFLLWDSRTFHCNTVPTRRGAVRACVYVCMLPRERVPDHVRVRRAAAFAERRTSSHKPGDGFGLFPALPRFAVDRDRLLDRVRALQADLALDALQQRLICGTPGEL